MILILSCLHITYTVAYPPVKNKLTGAKQKAAAAQAQAEAQAKLIIQLQDKLNALEQTKSI